MINRRRFLQSTLAAGALGALNLRSAVAQPAPAISAGPAFKMKYGPHAGHFETHAGKDVLDQIRFAHDQGFRAWEDNGLPQRPVETQVAMGQLLASLGMTMGVFVAYAEFRHPTFSGHRLRIDDRQRDPEAVREMLRQRMRDAVEIAKRVNARWCTVVPGAVDPTVPVEYQTANCVELLKLCAEICEPSGLVIVLEPLNYLDHPGCLLQRISHAHQVCKMVGSPSVKILDDLYHQQITEGNLINNLRDAWDEIAYIQVGDVPGRKEPTTGEINYMNVFRWLHDKGYDGVIGMEHGKSRTGVEGERALIDAYRAVDLKL
ncbi:MAG TPA: TIM barrel protein [Candidatus Synoicihabitans sp.]|nr:TIM barrel protein [Candidatus Synoicihabitans sp.]